MILWVGGVTINLCMLFVVNASYIYLIKSDQIIQLSIVIGGSETITITTSSNITNTTSTSNET